MSEYIKKLFSRFRPNKITSTERRFLLFAGVAAMGILLYGVTAVFSLYTGTMDKLDRRIIQNRGALEELAKIKAEFNQLNRQVGLLDQKIRNDQGKFSILSFLESLAARTNIRSKISYMRPKGGMETDFYREVSVEMKIESVSLKQAVQFLNAIENAPHVVRIKNLHFKTRYANPEFLDVNFLVSTYEPVG